MHNGMQMHETYSLQHRVEERNHLFRLGKLLKAVDGGKQTQPDGSKGRRQDFSMCELISPIGPMGGLGAPANQSESRIRIGAPARGAPSQA